jgi:hypothetical protein
MTNAPKRNHGKNNRSRATRGKRLASLGLMLTLGLFANSPAEAQALDGTAIQRLALKGTWAAQNDWGYWSWKKDKSVCFQKYEKSGKCTDTGTWSIIGDVMCYKLTWLWKSIGINDNCFTIQALKDGRYEALYHGGAVVSTFIKFEVLE